MTGSDSTDRVEAELSSAFKKSWLQARVLSLIEPLRVAPARYASRSGEGPSLAGAACAVAARHIVGALDYSSKNSERSSLIAEFLARQNPETGAFVELRDDANSVRIDLSLFGWASRALAMLGARPVYPAAFMHRQDEPQDIARWLHSLRLHRDGHARAVDLMNAGVFRVTAMLRGRCELEPSVDALFAWLDAQQDLASGFWGPARAGNLIGGLMTAFYVLTVYKAARRSVPHAGQIARAALDVWDSGCCGEDPYMMMAALGVLTNTSHRREELHHGAREVSRAAGMTLARLLMETDEWPLRDLVVCLEALRTAAKLSLDPNLSEAASWHSALDASLCVCEW